MKLEEIQQAFVSSLSAVFMRSAASAGVYLVLLLPQANDLRARDLCVVELLTTVRPRTNDLGRSNMHHSALPLKVPSTPAKSGENDKDKTPMPTSKQVSATKSGTLVPSDISSPHELTAFVRPQALYF